MIRKRGFFAAIALATTLVAVTAIAAPLAGRPIQLARQATAGQQTGEAKRATKKSMVRTKGAAKKSLRAGKETQKREARAKRAKAREADLAARRAKIESRKHKAEPGDSGPASEQAKAAHEKEIKRLRDLLEPRDGALPADDEADPEAVQAAPDADAELDSPQARKKARRKARRDKRPAGHNKRDRPGAGKPPPESVPEPEPELP